MRSGEKRGQGIGQRHGDWGVLMDEATGGLLSGFLERWRNGWPDGGGGRFGCQGTQARALRDRARTGSKYVGEERGWAPGWNLRGRRIQGIEEQKYDKVLRRSMSGVSWRCVSAKRVDEVGWNRNFLRTSVAHSVGRVWE